MAPRSGGWPTLPRASKTTDRISLFVEKTARFLLPAAVSGAPLRRHPQGAPRACYPGLVEPP